MKLEEMGNQIKKNVVERYERNQEEKLISQGLELARTRQEIDKETKFENPDLYYLHELEQIKEQLERKLLAGGYNLK